MPEWKVCPYCGHTASVEASPAASKTVTKGTPESHEPVGLGRQWHLWDRLQSAYLGGMYRLAILANAGPVDGVDSYITSLEADNYRLALEKGRSNFETALRAEDIPAGLRSAGLTAVASISGVPDHLAHVFRRLSDATEAVREEEFPEGFLEEFLAGAGRVLDYNSPAAWGAYSGAAIGSFIAPGIGTAIGGAVGAMLGGQQTDRRQQAILEAYDQAVGEVHEGFHAAFSKLWDTCAPAAGLMGASHFSNAEGQWGQLVGELSDPPTPTDLEKAEAFLDKFGPAAKPLAYCCRASIILGQPGAMGHAQTMIDIYPHDADTWEHAADAALEAQDYSRAEQHVQRGLALSPGHDGLILTQIEVLAATGRHAQASTLAMDQGETPWTQLRYAARGAIRHGDVKAAVAIVQPWVDAEGGATVHYAFKQDTILNTVAGDRRFPFPKKGHKGAANIVNAWLVTDSSESWYKIPNDRKEGAGKWLTLKRGEKVLFFLDWTLWGTGGGGLAITTKRVVWKAMWEDRVSVLLTQVTSDNTSGYGSNLTVLNNHVDIEREGLGEAVAGCLLELSDHYSRS